jgi:hypothetical protein
LVNKDSTLFTQKQDNNGNKEFVIKSDTNIVEFYTDSYMRDRKIIYGKENRGEISRETEYKIHLSETSKEMIEKDGGMDNIIKKVLSKENYEKIGMRFSVTVKVTMTMDGSIVTGHYFSLRSKNINECNLTLEETNRLCNYLQKITFIYNGNDFKDEIVPVGYTFVIRK